MVCAAIVVGIVGCAGKRIDQGVFHSPKGYRLTLPSGADWTIVQGSRADLELRFQAAPVAMLVNASCDDAMRKTPLDSLARRLLTGLRERSVLLSEGVPLDGKTARHSIIEGRLGEQEAPMKVEVYVARDARCVYDFIYAAPPETFGEFVSSFRRLVDSFAEE